MNNSFRLFEIKSLRNNYPSLAILTALILLSCLTSYAQYDSTRGGNWTNVKSDGEIFKNSRVNGGFIIPRDTPTLALRDSGGIAYKGGKFWIFNGHYWIETSSGTITIYGSNIDSLTFNGPTICRWKDNNPTCTDQSLFHATSTLNYNGTRILNYNLNGDLLADSVDLPYTDIYARGGLIPGDTSLPHSMVLTAGRLDTVEVTSDSSSLYFTFMSGANKVIRFIADGTDGADSLTFTPGIIPFASSTGPLTEDVGGLYYDGVNAYVGHNNPSVLSGIVLNGSRGWIQADLNGILFQSGVSTTYDASKHFRFRNGSVSAPYLDIYSVGTGPWVHHADFSTSVDILQSLSVHVTGDYADNAAAISAGLSVGTIYRTGDLLKIVH